MPTYEYRCRNCGHTFDVVQAMIDEPLTVCPVCGGELRKVFAPPAISFKGSGFYSTDRRTKSKTASEKSGEKPAASAESSDPKGGEKNDKKDTSKPAEKTGAPSSAVSGPGSGGSGTTGSTSDGKKGS
jgi:putative FmdB family regulatory protein